MFIKLFLQIARVISFSREIPNSYIEMERVSVDRDFEMTFKIKTEEPEGLLFYVTDDTTDQVLTNMKSLTYHDRIIIIKYINRIKRIICEKCLELR